MLARLFALLSLFGLSYAISCNSVSIQDEEGSMTKPTNVCFPSSYGGQSTSSKVVCDGNTAQVHMFENNLDCSGSPTTLGLCDALARGSTSTCSATSICNSGPCQYALGEVWSGVTSCDGDAPADHTSYSADAYIVGACELGYNGTTVKTSCTNGALTQTIYTSTTDCSGESIDSYTTSTCNAAYGYAIHYTCDLVAPGSTTAPTPQPTYGDDPISCNSVSIQDEEGSMTKPTNVCLPYGQSASSKVVCDGNTAQVHMFENNLDCSGSPTTLGLCDALARGSTSTCSATSICNS
eukprot:188190_1